MLLLVVSLIGLIFALFVDGTADVVATAAVAIPLLVIGWAIIRVLTAKNE